MATKNPRKLVALIDIGTTSLRMTIAQIEAAGAIHPVEFLQQAVSLGKDTFTKGFIEKSSIEECVSGLKKFRRVLEEFGIVQDESIRAVATTAVREATNREAFIDRVYIATGFMVEILDDRDVVRLTYRSAHTLLGSDPAVMRGQVLLCDMGGGSTELLVLQKGGIVLAQSYRLGSLRLREMLEKFNAATKGQRTLMESEIRRTVEQSLHGIPKAAVRHLIALGGDIRLAAIRLLPAFDELKPTRMPLPLLEKFTEEVLALSVNECVRRYRLSYPEAETLAPNLLFFTRFGRALGVKTLIVSGISMQHGALLEMAKSEVSDEDFRFQIHSSAWEIARKFRADEEHARYVERLCGFLFSGLVEEHRLSPWYGVLLSVAAILHDTGMYLSARSHHKHSMYLIQNSDLFGLSRRDVMLVSLVARYHRRATPRAVHPEYAALSREERLAVAKLAAILRVADALDRSHSQRIAPVACRSEKGRFVIVVKNIEDLTIEQLGIASKGDMFEEVYGRSVVLEKKDTVKE
jgi:exopolyphosphatase/guanosine-5'-triphosphate,3'-diphosphate pyrophosphatase